MEVPVGQINGADLLPDSVRVWIKCCPKDHVGNFQSRVQKKDVIREGTDSYIGDILVQETTVPASNLVSHLDRFG